MIFGLMPISLDFHSRARTKLENFTFSYVAVKKNFCENLNKYYKHISFIRI